MHRILFLILLIPLLAACDHGLEPGEFSGTGSISGTVFYTGKWPSPDSLQDLRFVALRFIPKDTSDFLQLNRMAISAGLQRNVDVDSFLVEEAEAGLYLYSGIAQQFESNLLSWRPVGLFEENDGFFSVAPGKTSEVTIHVDFGDLPIFPPDS